MTSTSTTATFQSLEPTPQEAKSQLTSRARDRRRALGRRLRQGALLAALLGATAAAALALRPRPVPVDLATISQGRLVTAIEESGTTRVMDRYVVSSPVLGSIARSALDVGARVAVGDRLTEVAPARSPLLDERARAEAQARLGATLSALGQVRSQAERARVALELAQQELARAQRLGSTLSQKELEQSTFDVRLRSQEVTSAEFAVSVAQGEVRMARVALGEGRERGARDPHIEIVAPVSGVVLRVHQKSATVVQAGSPLLELGDPAALEVVVDLLTTDAVQIHPGTAVSISGWGGARTLSAKVRQIEPSAFTRPSALGVDEQRVNVVIALTESPEHWRQLGDGYRVNARLVLWEGERVMQVPLGAVFRHGDGWAVFRVQDEVARLAPVTLGHRAESAVEVLTGLKLGDGIVVHPGDRVKDNVRVEPR